LKPPLDAPEAPDFDDEPFGFGSGYALVFVSLDFFDEVDVVAEVEVVPVAAADGLGSG
jgi:hypothetical protein